MQANDLNQITRILQSSITPVALISGVGLLVLSMTNRFARTTDRARALAKEIKIATGEDAQNLAIQIDILYRRSKILLFSITFALASIFFVSLLIITLFLTYLLTINLDSFAISLFIMSIISLIISLVLFIQDMTLSLRALKEELRGRF